MKKNDNKKEEVIIDSEPIHEWFELSYAQYLTIPRTALQSMPVEWQQKFVTCLNELDDAIDWRPKEGRYWIKLKGDKGRYVNDPLMDYQRGRRKLPLNKNNEEEDIFSKHKGSSFFPKETND